MPERRNLHKKGENPSQILVLNSVSSSLPEVDLALNEFVLTLKCMIAFSTEVYMTATGLETTTT